jgi:hypothetical protein
MLHSKTGYDTKMVQKDWVVPAMMNTTLNL